MAWQRKAALGGLLSGRIAAALATTNDLPFEWKIRTFLPVQHGQRCGREVIAVNTDPTMQYLQKMSPVDNAAIGANSANAQIEAMWNEYQQNLSDTLQLQRIYLDNEYFSGFTNLRIEFKYDKPNDVTEVFGKWDSLVQGGEFISTKNSCKLSPPEGGGSTLAHVVHRTWRCTEIDFVKARDQGTPLPDKKATDLLTLDANDDAKVTQAKDAFEGAMRTLVNMPKHMVTIKTTAKKDQTFWIQWDNLLHLTTGQCNSKTGVAFLMTLVPEGMAHRLHQVQSPEKFALARFGGPYEFEPLACADNCAFVPIAQAWTSRTAPLAEAQIDLVPQVGATFFASRLPGSAPPGKQIRFAMQANQQFDSKELWALGVRFPLFPRRAEMTAAQFCGSIRFQKPRANGQLEYDVSGASCTICTHMCAKSEAMEQSDASITQFKEWCRCRADDGPGLQMWDQLVAKIPTAGGKAQAFWNKVQKYSMGENRKHELFTGDATSFSAEQQAQLDAAAAEQQQQEQQQQQQQQQAAVAGQLPDAANAFVALVPAGTRTDTTTEAGCCGDSTTEDSASCSAEQESTSKTANGKAAARESKTCGGTEQESTTTKQAQESTTTKQAKSCGQGTCSNSNNINIKLDREE
eukprot:CAMPEP_0178988932 /NCGR_PEP_ID=MMETSP0795-20121207/4073_1 /TAXON_ID=88552 /ORGANISM="Amoebophrya sp., Strain Ameob2" /LENGTH=631 /DNA_ID=CAMNT_0020680237 /DNA_START=224 /DNA_END=2119 /DNA_ORIENTATION=+